MKPTQTIHVVLYNGNRKWHWQLVRSGRIVAQSVGGRSCRNEAKVALKALVEGIKSGHVLFDN